MKAKAFAAVLAGTLLLAPQVRGQGPATQEPIIARPPRRSPPGDFVEKAQPVTPRAAKFDAGKARRDAQELAELARRIQDEIDLISKSVFPKDLDQNLKRVQKLAKELRAQVSP